jgi:heat shock protein HslJ
MAGGTLLTLIVLAGCGGSGEKVAPQTATQTVAAQAAATLAPAAGNPLSGTEWRLVAIQSMDDSVGNTYPDDATKYTMRFNSDGTVNMALNCNRAAGNWTIKPGSDVVSGNFEFGPLAGTRALCPPPSLDERILAQAANVRGYLLKNGRLHLSLMADGGILIWEPHPDVPFQAAPDKDLEAAILKAHPNYVKAAVDAAGSVGRARYVTGRVDLNADGKDEVFVYLLGSFFCGTGGCNMLLFTDNKGEYILINKFLLTRLPLYISVEKTRGWRNIAWKQSGGGAPMSYVAQVFNGKKYVQGNRLPGDKEPSGLKYMVGELNFQKGVELAPNK